MRSWLLASILLGVISGCGTGRWSNTQRTATEQLLVSDAIDRAVAQIDFLALEDKKVYLDAAALRSATDAPYLTSTLRQQMLAHGCIVMDRREDADYIVEARTGAVGTDQREVLFGVPATKLPDAMPVPGAPSMIPEIPLAKKTEQRAVAKVALFAYNRETGRPVWQSGAVPVESKVKDVWVLGAGPFQRGTIVEEQKLASDKTPKPKRANRGGSREQRPGPADLAFFPEQEVLKAPPEPQKDAPAKPPAKGPQTSPLDAVVPAGHSEPAPIASSPATSSGGFWMLSPPGSGVPQPLTPLGSVLQAFPPKE